VTEVAPEEVVEEEAGPAEAPPARSQPEGVAIEPVVLPDPAAEADEPGRAAPTMEQLEKAVAEEAAGGDAALAPFRAAVLGETLSAGTSPKGPGAGTQARRERSKPRLVVYDFESTFDEGALGAKVADVLTGHAARSGLFETFAEVEQDEIMAAHPFAPRYDTTLIQDVARHSREHFDADLVLWGCVTGGREAPVIEAGGVDLRAGLEEGNRLVVRGQRECRTLHDIQVVVDQILADLLGRPLEPAAARVVGRIGPNLIANGAFERKGRGRSVPGWESPLPEGAAVEKGRLMLRLSAEIATTHGLGVYSDWIRVEPGAHYELSVRARAEGVTTIVWARGYTLFSVRSDGVVREGEDRPELRRETFRHQFRPASQVEPDERGWMAVTSKPFRPRHFRHDVKWMRVRLYAFGGGAGTAEFDDVVLRRVEVEGTEHEDETMLKAFGEKSGEAHE
jgi:hypothetical protein